MFVSGYFQRVLRFEARQQKMRWNALMVLNDLDLLGTCTQQALGDIEQIRAPTVTVLVRQMEERGWVRRTQSAVDARASLVSITTQGRAELRKANERLRRRVDKELQCIDEETQHIVGRCLMPLARELMRGLQQRSTSNVRLLENGPR
jgi:DNA-binding MarR family transcriptional regulator